MNCLQHVALTCLLLKIFFCTGKCGAISESSESKDSPSSLSDKAILRLDDFISSFIACHVREGGDLDCSGMQLYYLISTNQEKKYTLITSEFKQKISFLTESEMKDVLAKVNTSNDNIGTITLNTKKITLEDIQKYHLEGGLVKIFVVTESGRSINILELVSNNYVSDFWKISSEQIPIYDTFRECLAHRRKATLCKKEFCLIETREALWESFKDLCTDSENLNSIKQKFEAFKAILKVRNVSTDKLNEIQQKLFNQFKVSFILCELPFSNTWPLVQFEEIFKQKLLEKDDKDSFEKKFIKLIAAVHYYNYLVYRLKAWNCINIEILRADYNKWHPSDILTGNEINQVQSVFNELSKNWKKNSERLQKIKTCISTLIKEVCSKKQGIEIN